MAPRRGDVSLGTQAGEVGSPAMTDAGAAPVWQSWWFGVLVLAVAALMIVGVWRRLARRGDPKAAKPQADPGAPPSVPGNQSLAGCCEVFTRSSIPQLLIEPGSDCIVDANEAATRFLGYALETLKGKAFAELVVDGGEGEDHWDPQGCDPAARYLLTQRLATGGVRDVEVVAATGEFGGERRVHVSIQDVTERRRLDMERCRVRELGALSKMAGGVVHEVNTVLSIIEGSREIASEAVGPQSVAAKELEEIRKASSRAAAMVRRLMALSAPRFTRPELLDLNAVVRDTGEVLPPLVGEDIEVRVHLGESVGQVRMDRGEIQRVLINLAVRARDAMPRGGILALATEEPRGPQPGISEEIGTGPFWVVLISDTGRTMDAEHCSRLFDLSGSTSLATEGAGLSLHDVQRIVERAGGTIAAEGATGFGTTIRLRLPAAEVAAEAKADGASSLASGARERIVLVVEDEPAVRRLVVEMMRRLGWQVLQASSGEAAVEIAASYETVDLLLTDVVLPGVGGVEVARRLRMLHPGLKILYVSGFADDEIEAGELVADARFLAKPFTSGQLREALLEILPER